MNRHDLTQGNVFKTLFFYSLPIIITNLVQILFHAADVAILSFFAQGAAVAAVGACGSINTLLVSVFTGLATGANVLVAKKTGAKDANGVKRATGTALTLGFLSGLFLAALAVIFARRFLILAQCQEAVLDMATLYMQIFFLGMPITMLYNFVAAVLRASGDSVRPMLYMIIAGATNVLLNVLLVAVFDMGVAGVALATVLSNLLALVLALVALVRSRGLCRVERQHLKIRKEELWEIVRVGVPTCFCSIFFYFANVILSSCVNAISTEAMTANAYAGQFDGVIYTVGCAIAIATSAMVGQNFGAKRLDRIRQTMRVSLLYVTCVSLTLGVIFVLLSDFLLGLLTSDPAIITLAKDRMTFLCLTYFVTSIMEVFSFSLRTLRHQKSTMVVGAICGLGLRSLWAFLIWPMNRTLAFLFSCYTWSALAACIIYLFVYIKAIKKIKVEFTSKEKLHFEI